MNEQKTKKLTFRDIFMLCPARHVLLLLSALIIAAQRLTRNDTALMNRLSQSVVRPLHRVLSRLTDRLPFSAAELLIAAAVLLTVTYIGVMTVRIIRGGGRWKLAYKLLVSISGFVLLVYALFCMLWGVYYYGDDFISRSGLESGPVSTAELEKVTRYFADLANEYSDKVERDASGHYRADRAEILARSPEVFLNAEETFPCLAGPAVHAKGVLCSRVMSYTDFTGFFFPFTAEANVNTDFPPGLFASTVAHELSHQRGVAKEQEANFVAVAASLEYGDADYVYSAALLAYTHLGNALYTADREAWQEIYSGLNELVLGDFAQDRAYWRQFETPVRTVSNTVYEGFLHSYEQTLGLKSYGACVDLLVNYYIAAAAKK